MKIINRYIQDDTTNWLNTKLYFKEPLTNLQFINKEYIDHVKSVRVISGDVKIDRFTLVDFKSRDCILEIEVDDICSKMFAHCYGLRGIDLHKCDIEKIPDGFCQYCIRLNVIRFPNNLKEIGKFAFASCGIICLDLFNYRILKIDDSAFACNNDMADVVLPFNVYLCDSTFCGNHNIRYINLLKIDEFVNRQSHSDVEVNVINNANLKEIFSTKQDIEENLFIITSDHDIKMKKASMHHELLGECMQVSHGGGKYELSDDGTILNLYDKSQDLGEPNFDMVNFDIVDQNIKKILYNDKIIYDRA